MTTHTGSALLQTIDLRGPAGRLEALLNAGRKDAAYSVLVCHPHPLGGGTLHNKVVFQAMKAFQAFGLPVLRFNFRGTGLSEGLHDDGRGEMDDVRAAIDWLDTRFGKPLLFAGFSFGAAVGLEACCADPRVRGLVGLGLPVQAEGRDYRYDFLARCRQPKLFISGTRDEFGPRAAVEEAIAKAPPPVKTVWVEDGDHFFAGKLEQVKGAIHGWVGENFPLTADAAHSPSAAR
jgi:uncharacterized protein